MGENKPAGSTHNAKHHPLLMKSRGMNYFFQTYGNRCCEFFAQDPMALERIFHSGIPFGAKGIAIL
jgi:hypothetical protein